MILIYVNIPLSSASFNALITANLCDTTGKATMALKFLFLQNAIFRQKVKYVGLPHFKAVDEFFASTIQDRSLVKNLVRKKAFIALSPDDLVMIRKSKG